MRHTLYFAFIAAALSAQAPINVTAPVQRVRLHPDEAWVTRVAVFKIQSAGTHRLSIMDLPSGLGIQDVQVSARGPQGTRLGDFGIGVETKDIAESLDYQALKKERDALQDGIFILEAEIQALDQEVEFLSEFRAAYDRDISTKLVSGSISGASVVEMSASLSGRLMEILTKTSRQKKELGERRERIRQLDAKMRQMMSAHNARPSRATVELIVQHPGDVEIEVAYRTRQAQWNPAYEARLSADNKTLEIVLFASVRQTSGEDWDDVKLEITNARASRSLVMPSLPGAQTVTWSESAPMSRASVARDTTPMLQNIYVEQDVVAVEAEDGEAMIPVEAVSVEESRGLATTWSLEGSKDVPSNGEPYRFRILSAEIEPLLVLMAVPRVDATVYRVGRFPIPSGIPLFPDAPMVHFAGSQRLGEAPLIVPRAGQPMQLGFGPFRGVRVALSRIDARKDNIGTFTKETQWTLQERFEISNDLSEPVAVEIQDRELRAGNDRVKVAFQPDAAPIAENQIPGILLWRFDIQPRSTINMPFTYQIRVPQGQGRTLGIGNLGLPE